MSKTSNHRMLVADRRRGLVEVDVPSAAARSLIGRHHAAIGRYLDTGDTDRLDALAGRSFRAEGETFRLETDPTRIEEFALAGDLGYEDIYVLE